MKLLKLLLCFSTIILLHPSEGKISTDLVEKYFISQRNVRSVVMLLCNENDFTNLGKQFNNENIYFTSHFIGRDELNITNLFSRFFIASCGVLVDCGCPGIENILEKSSNNRYFNLTYSWMIFGAPGHTWEEFLDPFLNIEFSTDLIFVQKNPESPLKLNLVDVYSLGRHRGSSLIGIPFAEYDSEGKELRILINLWPKFRKTNRGNFQSFQLKAGAPIDRDNVTQDDVNPLLMLPGKTPGVASFVKYQSYLNFLIQDMHNFTLKYRITRAWAGHLPSGYRLGVLGVMALDEADICMSAIFPFRNRIDEFEFVHSSYKFIIGFAFRVSSESSDSSASLLAPLHTSVWISLILTMLIILIVELTVRIIFIVYKFSFSGSTAKDFVDIMGALCQQGIDPIPRNIVQRIIILFTLFLAFFLYNYYTSSVVGVLLSTPVKGPTTVEELLGSSYMFSFDDVGYHRILFREKKTPIVGKIYEKKMIGVKRGPKDLPMYTDIFSAVPFIKSGKWAYHCDLTEAYSAVAKTFTDYEICDLRTVCGLFPIFYLQAILPKFSQYKELMKIAFMHLQEVGFVKRALTIYQIEKPDCLSGISVFAVGFQAVSGAFYVLILGMCLSLLILVGEILWKKYSFDKKKT
uniref:Ionotropic receptor 75a N-terminal domain-containing protein n=2 Tax=Lutzomyia longipalpis TaxID=7200 RepID=A0A3F2ZDJ1_LUTLO